MQHFLLIYSSHYQQLINKETLVNTIVPYFHKPRWQDVHGKTAQELNTVQGKGLLNGPVPVIFGDEGYLSISYIQDTLVTYGHPVRVLSQVPDNVFSSCQGRFTMYHPLGIVPLLHFIVEHRQLVLLS